MLVRVVSSCMLTAYLVSKVHRFWIYWHNHSLTWHAADTLLASEVCTKAYLRTSLRQFDQCALAESSVAITPLHSAIYSVAEEMHVCGEGRCALLYMDITDRLVYILPITLVLLMLLLTKYSRDAQYHSAKSKYMQFALPEVTVCKKNL